MISNQSSKEKYFNEIPESGYFQLQTTSVNWHSNLYSSNMASRHDQENDARNAADRGQSYWSPDHSLNDIYNGRKNDNDYMKSVYGTPNSHTDYPSKGYEYNSSENIGWAGKLFFYLISSAIGTAILVPIFKLNSFWTPFLCILLVRVIVSRLFIWKLDSRGAKQLRHEELENAQRKSVIRNTPQYRKLERQCVRASWNCIITFGFTLLFGLISYITMNRGLQYDYRGDQIDSSEVYYFFFGSLVLFIGSVLLLIKRFKKTRL